MSPAELREKAERYRALALQITDPRTIEALKELAAEYEAVAAEIDDRDGR